jgi:UrcA family protein
MTMLRKTTTTLATMALFLATGSPAIAQQITRTVSYHDLDLTTAIGTKQLRQRLRTAVNYVCRRVAPVDTLFRSENQQCRFQLTRATKPQVDRAILLAERRAETQYAAR